MGLMRHKLGYKSSRVSRRGFLKLCGISVISAAFNLDNFQKWATLPAAPITLINEALEILKQSEHFYDVREKIIQNGFIVKVDAQAVSCSSLYPSGLLGLALRQDNNMSPRTGLDAFITVDLMLGTLISVQLVRGWSLLEQLVVLETTMFSRDPSFEIPRGRGDMLNDTPPVLIWPFNEKYWYFPRENPPQSSPLDLIQVGWPLETCDTNYWHYGGSSEGIWSLIDSVNFFRCNKISEQRNGEFQFYEINYVEEVIPSPISGVTYS